MKYMIKEKSSILQQYGFEWTTFYTDGKIKGWQNLYHHDIYYLWVNVCPEDKKVYLYKEYDCDDCSGEVWEGEEDIPYDMNIESEKFIEWLDKLIDSKIGE